MSKYSSFFLLSSPQYQKLGDKLRLRKYGSWLAEEAWLRDEQSQKRALFTLKAVDLAKKIAKELDISEGQAFEMLQSSAMFDDEFVGSYAKEAAALMENMPSNRSQMESLVTVFFRNRGEVLQGKKWEATTEWTEDDTRMLPKSILELVEAFMVMEETVSQGDEQKEEEDEEESEKN